MTLSGGDVDRIRAALDAGAAVDEIDASGYTALARAAMHGHTDVAELLLSRGADPDFRDRERMTPLIWAAVNKHPRVAALLLTHGAKPNLKDAEGHTALQEACSFDVPGALDVVKLLVDGGARTDLPLRGGFTALMSASFTGLVEVVEFLVSRGAALEHQSANGFTPLIQAIRGGRPRMVEKLLELGANPRSNPTGLATAIAEITGYLEHGDYDRDSYDFDGVLDVLRARGLCP